MEIITEESHNRICSYSMYLEMKNLSMMNRTFQSEKDKSGYLTPEWFGLEKADWLDVNSCLSTSILDNSENCWIE